MDINPWQVDSIQEFSFLKCPECTFDSKEEETFQDHAIENHPLSFILFGKALKEENFEDPLTFEEHKLDIEEDLNLKNEPENLFLSSISDEESFDKSGGSEDYENHSNDVAIDHEPKKKEKNYITTKDPYSYKCLICGVNFVSELSLNEHISFIHEGKTENQCTECDTAFQSKQCLKEHNDSVYEGKKLYQCDNSVHDGKKLYQCTWCEVKFQTKPELKNHAEGNKFWIEYVTKLTH